MMHNYILFVSSIAMLTACTQEHPAEIVYKGSQHYDIQQAQSPAPTVPDETPAMVLTKRQSPDRIFMTDNMSATPVKTEEEFQRVVESLKVESAKAETPITIVAIPVEKPVVETQEIAEYGARGLHGVKPMAKPQAPQWFAQRADDSANVTKGFVWPIRGKILSTFGEKNSGTFNDGINIAAPEGKPIHASADGEVVYAGNELAGYGNMLIVRHNNGWISAYAHTQKMNVGLGSLVSQGQAIAEVGKTGDVSVSQLHFGLRKDKKAVNPMDFLTDAIAANY
ncbi:MAG: M23 family metallopeptidase [Rickettsiales bacterium]|nr:M23 family metallopeptidase [Rickettsiales bacterium]